MASNKQHLCVSLSAYLSIGLFAPSALLLQVLGLTNYSSWPKAAALRCCMLSQRHIAGEVTHWARALAEAVDGPPLGAAFTALRGPSELLQRHHMFDWCNRPTLLSLLRPCPAVPLPCLFPAAPLTPCPAAPCSGSQRSSCSLPSSAWRVLRMSVQPPSCSTVWRSWCQPWACLSTRLHTPSLQ